MEMTGWKDNLSKVTQVATLNFSSCKFLRKYLMKLYEKRNKMNVHY
jgi:hypothetical protein